MPLYEVELVSRWTVTADDLETVEELWNSNDESCKLTYRDVIIREYEENGL